MVWSVPWEQEFLGVCGNPKFVFKSQDHGGEKFGGETSLESFVQLFD